MEILVIYVDTLYSAMSYGKDALSWENLTTKRPSYLYHQVHAVLGLVLTAVSAVVIFFLLRDGKYYQSTVIGWLLVLAWGIHSILHYYEEVHYDFNPFSGQPLVVHSKPVRH